MAENKFAITSGASVQLAGLENQLKAAQNLSKSKSVNGQAKDAGAIHDKEMTKAATQFESMLLSEMFKEMWATVPKGGMVSGSNEEESYQDMYRQALADNIAEHQSIGIKDVIIRDIKATEARHNKAVPEEKK